MTLCVSDIPPIEEYKHGYTLLDSLPEAQSRVKSIFVFIDRVPVWAWPYFILESIRFSTYRHFVGQ